MNPNPKTEDTLAPFYDPNYHVHGTEYVTETVTSFKDPDLSPPLVPSRRQPRKAQTMATATNVAPSAGGNLAHSATNDPVVEAFNKLIALTTQLGEAQGKGEDTQAQHLLAVTDAAFRGVVDNTVDKHGPGVDDATKITEAYWKARNKNVIFNPKAGNQRKTTSCVRQMIGLGGWTKGGPGEPIGMINRAMTQYKNLRKDPATSKRLMDAANYLIVIARRMKKSDQVLELDELQALAFKPDTSIPTVEDVLDGIRSTLKKLHDGKHRAGSCATTNIETAIRALNKELKGIADAKRSVQTEAEHAAAAEITAAADTEARQEKAGVAAPAHAA